METNDKPTLMNMAAMMIKTAQSLGMHIDHIRTLFDRPHADDVDEPLAATLKAMGVEATPQELRAEIIRILDALTPVRGERAFNTLSDAALSCIDAGRRVGLEDADILEALGPVAKNKDADPGLDRWLKRTNRTYTSVDLRNEISRRLRH